MALTNGPGSGQIAILGPRSGCSAAWIGILGILRRPASWRGATTIITSRKLKDAMRRTKAASFFLHSPSSHLTKETYKWIMQTLIRLPRLSSTVHWS